MPFPCRRAQWLEFENGALELSGTAPYEWLAPVRTGATKLPGISKISEEHLQIAYDPRLVLQRFTDRFNLPDSVNASVKDGVLVLAGEAPHAWLMRVRPGAPQLPGIRTIDEKNLTDLDQRAFQQSKSVIESAFVYFLVNKDNFATEGFAALSRLPDRFAAVSAPRAVLGSKSRSRYAVMPTPLEASKKISSSAKGGRTRSAIFWSSAA